MSKLKIYQKRGATNYKEKKLITALEKSLTSHFEKNPNLAQEFEPAKNFEELKALYNQYCVEEVQFEETTNDETTQQVGGQEISNEDKHKKFRDSMQETVTPKEDNSAFDNNTSNDNFVDPFNDAEPIVRDYVQDEGQKAQQQKANQTFSEPIDDKQAFEMPSSADEKSTTNKGAKKQQEPSKPLNPKFDEMDNGKKKRSTKRLAKMIVEGACLLAEKGCIWWTTKDITEDKLVQYEIEDTLDLQILLTLEGNQQITVRNWFLDKVRDAQTLFKVSDEDKSDLVDSLYEVLLEKGVAPTPMQELIINSVKTFILDMGLKAFALSSQINSVLTQLKQMKNEEKRANEVFDQQFEQQAQQESNTIADDVLNEETALATT
jgi:hypothetical protein